MLCRIAFHLHSASRNMEKVGKDEISHPQINATLVVMYAWGVFIVMCGSALHKPSCKKQHFSCIFFFNRLSENGKNCFSALGCYQKGRTLLNATVIIHPVFFLNSNCFRIMLHYYKNHQHSVYRFLWSGINQQTQECEN